MGFPPEANGVYEVTVNADPEGPKIMDAGGNTVRKQTFSTTIGCTIAGSRRNKKSTKFTTKSSRLLSVRLRSLTRDGLCQSQRRRYCCGHHHDAFAVRHQVDSKGPRI